MAPDQFRTFSPHALSSLRVRESGGCPLLRRVRGRARAHLSEMRHFDAAGFEARALYGLYVALLAVATPEVEESLQAELHRLESQLANPGACASRTGRSTRKIR